MFCTKNLLPVFPVFILILTSCDSSPAPTDSVNSPIVSGNPTVTAATVQTGTWTRTTNAAPEAVTGVFLLSDGSLMAQGPWISKNWYKLTPDTSGGYAHGTWSTLSSMSLERLYYGSGVLPSGKVYILGGEYSGPSGAWNFANTGEIYDPIADSWSAMAQYPMNAFGDDPTELLPNGNILAGFVGSGSTFIYNPLSNVWATGPQKLYNDRSDEETFVNLPDASVLTYNVFGAAAGHPNSAQRYVPSINQWVDAGVTPAKLENSWSEMGPAVLLPGNGKIFFIGASQYTALYTPPSTLTGTGHWEAGPTLPFGAGAPDAPAAVLPNGHVLFSAGATDNGMNTPTRVMDYDPSSNSIVLVATPGEMGLDHLAPFELRMLVLPTGQVLVTTDSDSKPWIFTPSDTLPNDQWMPSIAGVQSNSDGYYTLSGTQLNGLDEGSSYGDDFENSTNYPIVSLTSANGRVYYARTMNWSSLGVATGSAVVTTQFTLPSGILPGSGTYELKVIANGIGSRPYLFSP